MEITEVLSQVRPRLEAAFGSRLKGVILYGSQARGEALPDSDIDIMVLLDGPIRLGQDLQVTIHALYPLQLLVEREIDAMPVSTSSFEAQEFGLYREAKREGVPL